MGQRHGFEQAAREYETHMRDASEVEFVQQKLQNEMCAAARDAELNPTRHALHSAEHKAQTLQEQAAEIVNKQEQENATLREQTGKQTAEFNEAYRQLQQQFAQEMEMQKNKDLFRSEQFNFLEAHGQRIS